jgi:hypothetical protein
MASGPLASHAVAVGRRFSGWVRRGAPTPKNGGLRRGRAFLRLVPGSGPSRLSRREPVRGRGGVLRNGPKRNVRRGDWGVEKRRRVAGDHQLLIAGDDPDRRHAPGCRDPGASAEIGVFVERDSQPGRVRDRADPVSDKSTGSAQRKQLPFWEEPRKRLQ